MEIDSLQPLMTRNQHVARLLSLIYEPLVTISKEEVLSPMLATEWAMKDDLHWIVKLRKGVKWHNDSAFTATDVVFTVNTILNTMMYGQNSMRYTRISPIQTKMMFPQM